MAPPSKLRAPPGRARAQVMLQGILSLQDSFGCRALSLNHLRAAVRSDHFSRTLADRLPGVSAQLDEARAALDAFAAEADCQHAFRVRGAPPWHGASSAASVLAQLVHACAQEAAARVAKHPASPARVVRPGALRPLSRLVCETGREHGGGLQAFRRCPWPRFRPPSPLPTRQCCSPRCACRGTSHHVHLLCPGCPAARSCTTQCRSGCCLSMRPAAGAAAPVHAPPLVGRRHRKRTHGSSADAGAHAQGRAAPVLLPAQGSPRCRQTEGVRPWRPAGLCAACRALDWCLLSAEHLRRPSRQAQHCGR